MSHWKTEYLSKIKGLRSIMGLMDSQSIERSISGRISLLLIVSYISGRLKSLNVDIIICMKRP
jgi:hypothetical protein